MAQSMSDSQVLEYVKDGIRQGKEQKQLASELARKGVTKEQAMRVKQLYEQQNNVNTSKSTGTDINESRLREETKENTSDMLEDHPTTQDLARGDQVFGRNIFNTRNLTFEPSVNLATPSNYRLGPGDEVIIDIWGASQNTIRQQISPEGTINISKIGPVNLSGMTVSAANDYLKAALNKIYNGLNNTTDPTSDIRLTLGNIRTIQINVMGEVVQPGTYALSSFSTVFHALYRAGGVSDIGSLRNVQLVRNGKNIATIDVYEFIMKGNTQDDIRLQEGDVVIVPAYDALLNDVSAESLVLDTNCKKVFVIPATIQLAGAEIELVSAIARETRLKDLLEPIQDEFDFIFIDCPPSLGLLTINALTAADSVLIPIQCEYYALEGVTKLLESMKMVKSRLNKGLDTYGVLMTMYDSRTSLSNQVVEEVQSYFGDKAFKTLIPRTVKISEAPSFGEPVITYAPQNKGAKAYMNLAKEVIKRA